MLRCSPHRLFTWKSVLDDDVDPDGNAGSSSIDGRCLSSPKSLRVCEFAGITLNTLDDRMDVTLTVESLVTDVIRDSTAVIPEISEGCRLNSNSVCVPSDGVSSSGWANELDCPPAMIDGGPVDGPMDCSCGGGAENCLRLWCMRWSRFGGLCDTDVPAYVISVTKSGMIAMSVDLVVVVLNGN